MDKALLIFDLDETLIHATESPLSISHDFIVGQYYVHKRPLVDDFIRKCSDFYCLAVWTSAGSGFASEVVQHLFGDRYTLEFVWSSERCTQRFNHMNQEYYSLKKLSKVKNIGYDIDRILMIDDTPKKLSQNYGNYIRIRPFEGDQSDREFEQLGLYLESIADEPDLRSIEKRVWRDLEL